MNYELKIMNKLIVILLIIGLILPSFGSIHSPQVARAQKLPENFEDINSVRDLSLNGVKGIGERMWENFLSALKGAWEKALQIWQKMWDWFKNIWKSYIFPFFEFIWQKILNSLWQILVNFWEKLIERLKGLIK